MESEEVSAAADGQRGSAADLMTDRAAAKCRQDKLEDSDIVWLASTEISAQMHEPSDSRMVSDAVRVMGAPSSELGSLQLNAAVRIASAFR